MDIKALKQLLEQLKIPVEIALFLADVPLPYIVILPTGTESIGSDFAAELRRSRYQIELYTVKKEFVLEDQLEAIFDGNGIHFQKLEAYIDEEAMYQCAYQIELYYVK